MPILPFQIRYPTLIHQSNYRILIHQPPHRPRLDTSQTHLHHFCALSLTHLPALKSYDQLPPPLNSNFPSRYLGGLTLLNNLRANNAR